jgi:hypothetical protein
MDECTIQGEEADWEMDMPGFSEPLHDANLSIEKSGCGIAFGGACEREPRKLKW